MTPARFDILFVAWRADWQVHENRRELGLPPIERRIAMWELRDLLGLAGPTISRTAHRLDELELVRVVRAENDARCAVVVLTELGERMLRLAVECIRQDELGMRDCMVKYLSDGAFDRLSEVEPADRTDLEDRLCALVEQPRRYAQFFGCQAVPIYDTRVVMHFRPRTVSLLTWNIEGPDPRSEIMRMNQVLIEAAGPVQATRGLLDSLPALDAPSAPLQTAVQREPPTPELSRHGESWPPWRLEDLPADYFWSPKSVPTSAD